MIETPQILTAEQAAESLCQKTRDLPESRVVYLYIKEPVPICTSEDGAMRYLCCSKNRLAELRRKGIIKRLGNDWYSYDDLYAAIQYLRKHDYQEEEGYEEKEDQSNVRREERPMASKGDQPDYRPSAELFREVERGSRTKSA